MFVFANGVSAEVLQYTIIYVRVFFYTNLYVDISYKIKPYATYHNLYSQYTIIIIRW